MTAPGTRTLDGHEVPAVGTWKLDLDHTRLGFVARHMVFTKVRGRFTTFDGAITIAERLEDSTVAVDADVTSITTEVAERDAHLRSADFFDAENHPTMTFRSTAVDLAAMTLTGDLSIRGTTRSVTLDFTYEGVIPYPWGGIRAMFTATGEVDRDEWGVNWNQALETGGWLVSKKVELEIEAQGVLVEDEG